MITTAISNDPSSVFQSRNRGSFDFKPRVPCPSGTYGHLSFNLVIEVLLISRQIVSPSEQPPEFLFQSRNRGSFDFKFMVFLHAITQLALEFQSRNRGSFDFKVGILPLFLFMRDFVSIS